MGDKADQDLEARAAALAAALTAELGERALAVARAQQDSATDGVRAAWARVLRALERPDQR